MNTRQRKVAINLVEPIPEASTGKGWGDGLPVLPIHEQMARLTELEVLEALRRLLEDNPHLTGYILTGVEVNNFLRQG